MKNQMDLNTYSDMVFALNAINMMLPDAIRKDYLPYIDRIKKGLLSVDVYNPDDEETSKGEWIYGEDNQGQDGWFCSECNFFVPWYYEYYINATDFIREYSMCPHCKAEIVTYTGAETRGDKE